MDNQQLMSIYQWDNEWAKVQLPLAYKRSTAPTCINAIMDVLDEYLPRTPGLAALEIGGAVGGYLAYLHKTFGYDVTCMDYSEIGCSMTRENFRLLGIPGKVVQADLFADPPLGADFDLVYSLGVIEHLAAWEQAIERHLRFLKPGGTLIIGVPSYLGINHWPAKRLAPRRVSELNLSSMNIGQWKRLGKRLGLERRFLQYIGGFYCGDYLSGENPTGFLNHTLQQILGRVQRLPHRFPLLAKVNGRWISCYAMGVWKRP